MKEARISVVAKLKSKPGLEEQVKGGLMGLVEPSRKDKGCINYDLHQSVDDPCLFVFYENWESKADLDKHLAMPHVEEGLGRVIPLLAEPPELTLFRMLRASG